MRKPAAVVESRHPSGYSRLQIALHWGIVLLLLVQFLTGDAMAAYFDRMMEAQEAAADQVKIGGAALVHFVMGTLVLATAVVRTVVRRMSGVPDATPESPEWDRVLSHWNHRLLYAMLWITPILGGAAYLMGSEAAGEAHEIAKTVLLVLVVLHVLGALYHQFVLRDGLIRRMVRPTR